VSLHSRSPGEFDRIRRILAGAPPLSAEVLLPPGDDAVQLAGGIVLSTDLSIEGIHFRLDWMTPEEAGNRAARAALSDLAAMAAQPLGVLVSVAAPGDGELAERAMAGVNQLLLDLGIPLLKRDLTRSPGPLLLDVVVVGRAESPLLRSGVRGGDELWVTGTLGGAAAAVLLLQAGGAPLPEGLRAPFLNPTPRLAEARWLREAGVRAAIDLSDGLAGDALHLAEQSGVALHLVASKIPLHPALGELPLPEGSTALDLALRGGEDYELLLAAPPGVLGGRVEEFRSRFDLILSPIGGATAGSGVHLDRGDGELLPLDRGGFDHFRGENR